MPQNDKIVHANGVDLRVETLGDPSDPAILLIGGSGASMDWWEDELCERLGAGPRFVIRYDHRDTGQSVSYEPGAPRYTFSDLVDDAVGLLDTLGLAGAHIVGISMGGAIAQALALVHPDRVASLTLISTAPAAPRRDDADLPTMSEETGERFAQAPEPDWSDRKAVVDYIVYLARVSSGSRPFDEAAMGELSIRERARAGKRDPRGQADRSGADGPRAPSRGLGRRGPGDPEAHVARLRPTARGA